MAHKKGAGSSRNGRDSQSKRLGVKLFGGQKVKAGQVIVRQVGQTKLAGAGTYISRNFTIHAEKDGIVQFRKVKKQRFTGKTVPRTEVMVV